MNHLWVRNQHGGATVEITLLTPLLLLFLLLVVFSGRSVSTKLDVDGAASDAARAASLERSPQAAIAAAMASINANVESNNKKCRSMTVTTDTSSFRSGGSVSVDVRCTIDVSDLSLLRLSGTHVIHAHATEPVDVYRAVSG